MMSWLFQPLSPAAMQLLGGSVPIEADVTESTGASDFHSNVGIVNAACTESTGAADQHGVSTNYAVAFSDSAGLSDGEVQTIPTTATIWESFGAADFQVGDIGAPNTASLRQQIVDKIETKLGTILISNGYQSDIGSNVVSWQLAPPVSLPAVSLRDACRQVSDHVASQYSAVTVDVEVFGASGFTDRDIRMMIQDVVKAFGTNVTWDGLALDTQLVSDCFKVDTVNNVIQSGLIKFNMTYRGSLFGE